MQMSDAFLVNLVYHLERSNINKRRLPSQHSLPPPISLLAKSLQALYAETLMSYEEFNQMFAQFKEHYWKAKAQLPLSLEAFPEVYDKVSRQGRQRSRMKTEKTN